jgi:endo-1,4-beta-xylanase
VSKKLVTLERQKSVSKKLVTLAIVAFCLVVFAAQAAQAATPPARSGPVLQGAAFQLGLLSSDSQYQPQLLSHGYKTLTPEFEQYMDQVETSNGYFDFSKPDAMLAFAQAHGLELRGHVLMWGLQVPYWVTNPSTPWTAATLTAVMDNWITTVMTRYKGQIHEWDVINEPLNDDGTLKAGDQTTDSMHRNIWGRIIGQGYIEHALRTAHAADPSARLVINEYSNEYLWAKSDALYSIAQDFKNRGVPLDAIGFQIHSDTRWPVPYADLKSNMTRFGALGLRTEITEMDVGTSHYSGTQDQKYAAEATIYHDAAQACLDSPTCWEFTTWGFTDKYTWLGSSELPLPFDINYAAKPAWTAIQSVLGSSADTTPPSAPTNLNSPSHTSSSVSLSWTASTDNVGVTGYQVFRGGTQVGTPTSTSYTDTGLAASTLYTYTVKARDAAGNVSAASNSVSVTTSSGGISSTAWYNVVNQNSGLCVDAYNWQTTDGTAVQQWGCGAAQGGSPQTNQEWQFQPTDSGYYKVLSRSAAAQNEVWDVTGGPSYTGDGVQVQLWHYIGGTNQQWMPVSLDSTHYKFIARHSSKCLNVTAASTAYGARLQQWTCNGQPQQSFSLVAQP